MLNPPTVLLVDLLAHYVDFLPLHHQQRRSSFFLAGVVAMLLSMFLLSVWNALATILLRVSSLLRRQRPFPVFVKNLQGGSLCIRVDGDTTVSHLRRVVEQRSGLGGVGKHVRLWYGTKCLDTVPDRNATVSSLEIHRDSTLEIRGWLCGGGKTRTKGKTAAASTSGAREPSKWVFVVLRQEDGDDIINNSSIKIKNEEDVSDLKERLREDYSGGSNPDFKANHITVYGCDKNTYDSHEQWWLESTAKNVDASKLLKLMDRTQLLLYECFLAVVKTPPAASSTREDGTIGELSQRTAQLNLSGNAQASTSHGADASVSVPGARAVILMKQSAGDRVQNDATELPRAKETVSALKRYIKGEYSGQGRNPQFAPNHIEVYACKDPKFADEAINWQSLVVGETETWKQFVNDKELEPMAQLESGHCYLVIVDAPPQALQAPPDVGKLYTALLKHLRPEGVRSTNYTEFYELEHPSNFDIGTEFPPLSDTPSSVSARLDKLNKLNPVAEKDLQRDLPDIMRGLTNEDVYDVVDTSNTALLGQKGPDVTLFRKGAHHTNINAVLCGEFKTHHAFREVSSKGQALNYAILLLDGYSLRPCAYTFLTDGREIFFFKAERRDEVILTYESAKMDMKLNGISLLHSLLSASPEQLGFPDPPTVQLDDALAHPVGFLGSGATSAVYKVQWKKDFYVLKVASSIKHDAAFAMKKQIADLEWAQNSKHIPRVVKSGELPDGKQFLLSTPVASPFRLAGGFSSRHAISLLDVLKKAHDAGYVHRDVRPNNILVSGDDALLIDWGFAAKKGESTPYAGTVRYASDNVLTHLKKGNRCFAVFAEDDMQSLVRSVCSLLSPRTHEALCACSTDYDAIQEFWKGGSVPQGWTADSYESLKRLLENHIANQPPLVNRSS